METLKKTLKKKKTNGVTLLELIVAMGILSVAAASILAMMFSSVQSNADSHRITIATLNAQQAVEEFIGRPWEGDLMHFPWGTPMPADPVTAGSLNFWVVSTYSTENLPPGLVEITVTIFDSAADAVDGTRRLSNHSYIINTNPIQL